MDGQRVQGENRVVGAVSGAVVRAQVINGGVHVHSAIQRYAPRQLPLVPTGFTGREAELSALDEVCS